MKLVTFGDSWVWGDELEPENNTEYNHEYNLYRHTHNIGGVIYNNNSFTNYINYATNGGSNQHILFDLMNYINSDDYDINDVILVGMTSPMRNILYSNISKTPLTWPGWDYDSYMNYCDSSLNKNKDFENWWKSHIKINLNNRNDILSYIQTCLSIKSLLINHKRYLVWQSIDGNFWEYENDFKEVYLEKYTNECKNHDMRILIDDFFIFNKDTFQKELDRGLLDTQIWINTKFKDWKTWLEENYNHDDVFVWSSNHPNKKGIKLWYDEVISVHLKNVLKGLDN